MLHISLMEAAIFAKTVATVTVFQQVLPVMYMQVSSLLIDPELHTLFYTDLCFKCCKLIF